MKFACYDGAMKPLLAICIPTYNRADYLRTCLESITSQFTDKSIAEQMEVIISDNASTDNTTAVVKEFQIKFPNIKYFRFEKNLGVDRNILNIVEQSSAEYCLPIGDDDAFFPGSFASALEKIKKYKVPYYMLNSWGYDHALKNPVMSHPVFLMKDDTRYAHLSDYVHTIKKYTNLVGGFCGLSHIISRDAWMRVPNKEQWIGTNAIHYFIILSAFKDSPFAFLAEPLIKTRSSNIRWDVFPGLGSIHGRIVSTIKLVTFTKDLYHLPMSKLHINLYFYTREYWFTGKEIAKRYLAKAGLGKIIDLYRKLR